MLKIANILEEGKLGGPQVRVVEIAKCLKGRVSTTVFIPKENSAKFQKKLKKNNIEYIALHLSRLTKEKIPFIQFFFFFPYEIILLYWEFKKGDFQVVHVSGGVWQIKGLVAGKLAGCKVLWHLNDTQMPFFIILFFKVLSRLADGFIVSANRVKDYYLTQIDIGKRPVFLARPPVDTHYFTPYANNGDNYDLKNEGEILVSTLANVNPVKGLEAFVRMACKVNQKHSNIKFVVAGSIFANQKRYFNKLQNLMESLSVDNIRFLDGVENPRDLLGQTDIYVCTSVAESGPMSLWEAMSMENAVVTTDVGDVSQLFTDGEDGFVVPVNDVESLADKVCLLIANKLMRQCFGLSARKVAIEKLDVKKCSQAHETAYSFIAGSLKSP